MIDWTIYTFDAWWNPFVWQWWPEITKREDGAILCWLFFSIRGQRL